MSSKLIRLGPSGIEYLDYVWNFYSGCQHKENSFKRDYKKYHFGDMEFSITRAHAPICPPVPCWAEEMTKRFRNHYPNGFAPTFYPEAFLSPLYLKKPSVIGVCFMGDLFGDWVDPDIELINMFSYKRLKVPGYWTIKGTIFEVIKTCPQHTFIFLTKNPAGMVKWGRFPDNCWVGFSATNPEEFTERLAQISKVEARVKWCSLEPLLNWDPAFKTDAWRMLDWVAIGALMGTRGQIEESYFKYAPKPAGENWTPNEIKKLEDTGGPPLKSFKLSAGGNRWGLMPSVEWLKSIVGQLDACGVKVFLKDNLLPILRENDNEETRAWATDLKQLPEKMLRQEVPER
jgi:protein gp37